MEFIFIPMALTKEALLMEGKCKEMENLFQLMADLFMKEIGVMINPMDKGPKNVQMDLHLQVSLSMESKKEIIVSINGRAERCILVHSEMV